MPKIMLFLLIFSRFFLITFFLLVKLFFTHFLHKCLKTYQYLLYLASSIPPNIFHSQHGGKILGNSQQWAKVKIIEGMEVKYWGMYPPGICSPAVTPFVQKTFMA